MNIHYTQVKFQPKIAHLARLVNSIKFPDSRYQFNQHS